jgi:hypothetical protein
MSDISYNSGMNAAYGNAEVQIYFVTSSKNEAKLLAKRLVGLTHSIEVNWVRGDQRAGNAIKNAMASRMSWAPSAIILDYASLGKGLWSLFGSLRRAVGDRYVEYVVFDLPRDECERPELCAANVTVLPMEPAHSVH